MSQQTINLGTTAGDGTGDSLRVAGAKLNAMFGETYTGLARQRQDEVLSRLRAAFARALVSNPETLGAMASPPTVTLGSAVDAALTNIYLPNASPDWFMVTGARYYFSSSNTRAYFGTNNVSGDTGNVNGFTTTPVLPTGENAYGPYYLKVSTDAPSIQLQAAAFAASTPIRVIVDGQYINLTGWDMSGSNNYLEIAFGSRRNRVIEFELQGSIALFRMLVDIGSKIWKPVPRDTIRTAVTGDSIHGNNSGDGVSVARWGGTAAITSRLLGVWDARFYAVDSTGYLATGTSTLRYTIRQQMDSWINDGQYDLIFIAGGYNDQGFTPSAVQAEALLAFQKARLAQPGAFIVVRGLSAMATGPSASLIATENAVLAAFNAWADPFSAFIPDSTSSRPSYSGTNYSGYSGGVAGNSASYISTDGIHNTLAAGQAYLGYRDAEAIRQAVFSFNRQ